MRWPPPPRHRYPSPVRAIRALSSILRTIIGPICMRCASGPCPPPRAFAMYDSAHLSRGRLRFAPSACRLVASSYDCTTVRRRFPAVIILGETSPRLCGRVVAAFPIMSAPCCCSSLINITNSGTELIERRERIERSFSVAQLRSPCFTTQKKISWTPGVPGSALGAVGRFT